MMIDIIHDSGDVYVPISLALTVDLTTATKLLWMGLKKDDYMLNEKVRLMRSRLGECLGLSRHTITNAIQTLINRGWCTVDARICLQDFLAKSISMPVELLLDRGVSCRAKLVYAMLLAQLAIDGNRCRFKYSSLSEELKVGVKTLRHSIGELVQTGWLDIFQKSRVSHITFVLQNPVFEFFENMKASAKKNIDEAPYKGEAIMKEELTLLVNIGNPIDNAALECLRNPETNELLEIDRYYSEEKIAFEFNGPQHYGSSEIYDKESVKKQQHRDAIKLNLCKKAGITLITIRSEELSIETLLQKVIGVLPLRNLVGARAAIDYLSLLDTRYRGKVISNQLLSGNQIQV